MHVVLDTRITKAMSLQEYARVMFYEEKITNWWDDLKVVSIDNKNYLVDSDGNKCEIKEPYKLK